MQTDEYYAIIVSYNPDLSRLEQNVHALRLQGMNILVIDNGSHCPPNSFLNEDELILLYENKGIAAALNIGMEEAERRKAKWVLSLDQDTIVDSNIIHIYEKYTHLPDAGALCPRIIRKNETALSNDKAPTVEEIERCPTAGFYLNVKAWKDSGGYDEWMFIDYVDYDICMKLRIAGYKLYRINDTYVIQELGNLRVNPIFYKIGRVLNYKRLMNFAHIYNHAPIRNYYFVRNSSIYIYKYKSLIDVKEERFHVYRWEIKKLLLEPRRTENIRSIIKGKIDYKKKIKEGIDETWHKTSKPRD